MRSYHIPNYGTIQVKNVLFDVNGTIQFNGKIPSKIKKKIRNLKSFFNIFLISADTRGNLNQTALELGVTPIKISPSEHSEAELKNNELIKLGREETIAIGNGNNDSIMLKNAIIGIAILGKEGLASKALLNSDLVFSVYISSIKVRERLFVA
ncbi:MAG: hypothetical protein P8Y23_04050 [Candidatus Lokiarchaeota archaeon]